ncbi:MAG TPA: FAD-binding protein [Gaiellaceae bacterium]|nr:FAD-binding protein [Gaiellaceae bacterium]
MTVVAGAGMAGLVTAARLRELGRPATLLEKGDRPGGSMLLSSGVVWRHRTFKLFREEGPDGREELQRLIFDRLDGALDWLERIAVSAVERETGNPRTVGRRFEPRALTEALVRAAGGVELSRPLADVPEDEPVVLATGGFARLVAPENCVIRAAPWSGGGDGFVFAVRKGAAFYASRDELYARALPGPPARVGEEDFVRAAQLYGRFALALGETGRPILEDTEISWHESELVERLVWGGGTGWYVVDADALEQRVRERTVAEMVAVAEELGAEIRRSDTLAGLDLGQLCSPKLARPPYTAVRIVAGVTHTIGGLLVDAEARVLRWDETPIDGLFVAGVDAGLVASGGYASGLAQALVLGLAAAESIAAG